MNTHFTLWKAPSEEAQGIWDTMEDDDKAKILALSEQRKAASHTTSSTVSVNAHDIATLCDSPPAELTEDLLLAMITKHSNRASKPSLRALMGMLLGLLCRNLSSQLSRQR